MSEAADMRVARLQSGTGRKLEAKVGRIGSSGAGARELGFGNCSESEM